MQKSIVFCEKTSVFLSTRSTVSTLHDPKNVLPVNSQIKG